MSFLFFLVLAPFIAACVIPFLYRFVKSIHTGWFALVLPITLFVILIRRLPIIMSGQHIEVTFPWMPSLGIDLVFYLDGLSMLFGLLITGIGSLVVLYSIFYLAKGKEKLDLFYLFLFLFMGAMLGLVFSDNALVLYGFWELTSISSFLLIAYWHHRDKSRYGAMKSMMITVLGGLGLLSGFITMYVMTGSFRIREWIAISPEIMDHSLFLPAMLLILLGAFTKSAQFPFHIWLPDAMEAPTPVSAYLHSATMVKAGIYLVARLSVVFGGSGEWFWLVSGFGIVTLIWGSISAVRQTDLKSILAYSTISQLGMIMSLLGIGSATFLFEAFDDSELYAKAMLAAMFHLINHATFKGALFMAVGIVDHETGTRDIRKLGGLMTVMPVTFTITMIGSLSMAGLPPFNGFLSKEMFFTALLHVVQLQFFDVQTWGIVFPVVGWIASVFTFVYCLLLFTRTFLGKKQFHLLDKKPHEAPIGMLVSPVILVSLVVIFGFFPNLLSKTLLEPVMASILPPDLIEKVSVHIAMWHGWNVELFMTIAVIVIGSLILTMLYKWNQLYQLFPSNRLANRLYDSGWTIMERSSNAFNRFHMTGYTRDYLAFILGFMVLVVGYTRIKLIDEPLFRFDFSSLALYEMLLGIVMVVAAFIPILTSSRITAVISVGVVGYMVSLFYILFRAPDLALTQLVIETVSVALFLLAFYHLPKFRKERATKINGLNLVISIAVGVLVTILAMTVQGKNPFGTIADYYMENSYKLAGGKNMVNVILVDFRGFDTMLEILVLGIASLGVYALIKLKMNRNGGLRDED